jgi:hypothetical protein
MRKAWRDVEITELKGWSHSKERERRSKGRGWGSVVTGLMHPRIPSMKQNTLSKTLDGPSDAKCNQFLLLPQKMIDLLTFLIAAVSRGWVQL